MKLFIKNVFICCLLLVSNKVFSQDDLLSLLEENKDEKPKKVYATFKTVKIGNAQSIETVKKNHLDFGISHRFGNIYDSNLDNPVNEMFQSAFGLDNASDIRISFDYGVLDNLSVGIGRSKMNKLIDGNLKWRILQQTVDFKMPISLAFFGSVGYSHAPTSVIYNGVDKTFPTNEAHRFNYFSQIIIASKVTSWLSLEILPSYMYRNFIKENVNTENGAEDQNGFFSIGIGGRIKLNKRMSIIGDYFYNVAPYYQNSNIVFNPLALGFEIETGGHVFSMFFTNASGLIENNFMPYTTDSWSNGQVKLGFRISRTFAL
jgi:hypothetical protein